MRHSQSIAAPALSGVHRTAAAHETEALAARVAAVLVAGDVVLLSGELGSGKTTFVRGAGRALGVRGAVTSPSFTIGRRYEGNVPVAHLDLYRIDGIEREDPALLADYLTSDRVAFIEWPAIAEPALEPAGVRIAARVWLAHRGGDAREITVATGG